MEFKASELHPPVDWNEKRRISVLAHIGDFSCISGVEALIWWPPSRGIDISSGSGGGILAHLDGEPLGWGCYFRKLCSTGCVHRNGGIISPWSKGQTNVAQSRAEAGLDSVVKGLSEGIGAWSGFHELFGENGRTILVVGASACKGILLHTGTALGAGSHAKEATAWACTRCIAPNTIQTF